MRSGLALAATMVAACLATSALATSALAAQSAVARGRYLVETIMGCGNCHTPKGPDGTPVAGRHLAGGFVVRDAAFTAVVPNITQDRATGIGAWSDAEIARAIREGKRPDGSTLGPPMPFEFYRGIADDDLKAIVAYLRTIKPVENKVEPSTYGFPLPPGYGPPVGHVAAPPRADRVAYGRYLAGPLGHCLDCHTPRLAGGRLDMARLGAGGFKFEGPWGTSVAANITSDRQDGLGGWSDAEIEHAVRDGVSRDGRRLFPPMPYAHFKQVSKADMGALIAYLRTIPPQPRQ